MVLTRKGWVFGFFAKLEKGKTVRIKNGTDIDELFQKEMPASIP